MANPVDIITERNNKIKSLWQSKNFKEIAEIGYHTDATVLSEGKTYNGRDEIFKMLEENKDLEFKITDVQTSAPVGDTVEQTVSYEIAGTQLKGKVTWKFRDNDWKVIHEDWN